MKYFLFSIAVVSCLFSQSCSNNPDPTVLPTPSQVEWAESEIGVIIHYDINVFTPETFKYEDSKTLPDLKVFNPSRLSTDQWMDAAQALGAKYAVLVVKHGTGFSLWPTKAHNYHVGNTPWRNGKGDIFADFIQSCAKRGIKPGIYYNTNCNSYYGAGYRTITPEEQAAYNKVVLQQLTELWTGYGPLFEIWFDGGVMIDEIGGIASQVNKMIAEHQSTANLFQGPIGAKNLIRWIGNEDGRATYPNWSTADQIVSADGIVQIKSWNGSPDGKIWFPAEADFPNRTNAAWNGGWLWKAGEDQHVFPADELLDRYYTSVGMNANMLIGMGIDTAGLFPEADVKQFTLFGNKIKKMFGTSLAETFGKGNEIKLSIPENSKPVDHVIIQEDIKHGERIRKYVIEAWVNKEWKNICEGISVGHKRIQKIQPVQAERFRLRITESVGKPQIKKFAVYYAQ